MDESVSVEEVDRIENLEHKSTNEIERQPIVSVALD